MASASRRIRRNLASDRGRDALRGYASRKIDAAQRDALLLALTPSPRGFNATARREAVKFLRDSKAYKEAAANSGYTPGVRAFLRTLRKGAAGLFAALAGRTVSPPADAEVVQRGCA